MTNDRATPDEISSYYKNYVKLMGLQKNLMDNTYITSVQKLHRGHDDSLREETGIDKGVKHGQRNWSKETDQQSQTRETTKNGRGSGFDNEFHNDTENSKEKYKLGEEEKNRDDGDPLERSTGLWEVRGYHQLQDDTHVPFSLFAENVILATGASDSPARLGVEGEDLPYVFNSVHDLSLAIKHHSSLGPMSDPVLVVGAGLSAADAVLCAYNHRIPVLHAFRKRIDDPSLIFKQLPKTLYPEYQRVYQMMCSQTYLANPTINSAVPSASTTFYSHYTSFPEHNVASFQPDKQCILRGSSGTLKAFKVSMVLVLIGANPNLFFLKEHGQYLGVDLTKPISCRHNPVDINPYTFECTAEPGLFAMGPLVGDNFVRFIKGGALGIASCLFKRLKHIKLKGKYIDNDRICGEVGESDASKEGGDPKDIFGQKKW